MSYVIVFQLLLYLNTWFSAELLALRLAEVIVGVERGVERGDEVEQGLGADGVTQLQPTVVIHLTAGAIQHSARDHKKNKNKLHKA